MVGASINNDWSAALWREEEEEGYLFAAPDVDEMLLLLLILSCFLPSTPPSKRNWSDRPRTRLGLSGLASHLAKAATSSSKIDGGMCLATSSAKHLFLLLWLFLL